MTEPTKRLGGVLPATGPTKRLRVVLIAASLAAAAACASGSKSNPTGPPSGGSAANIVKVSGDSQAGPYEAALPNPLVVKVTDAAGNAVSDASVAWLITLDGAAQTLSLTTTNSNGQTQFTPTLGGIPGAFSVTAGINNHSVTFRGMSNVTLANGPKNIVSQLFANCALTAQGAAFCWGNGFGGQLGNGTTGAHTGPVPVSGGYTFSQISMSPFATCAVTTAGALYCWGDPSNAAFGNGVAMGGGLVQTPTSAGSGRTFSFVAVGQDQMCGISSGATYCWGPNNAGQLGDGDTVHQWAPAAVKLPSGVSLTSLTAGGGFTCGLTSGGAAYCWGSNYFGQLGMGSATPAFEDTPVLVTGGHVFASLSAGPNGLCGLTTAGAIYCWGSGASGNGTSGNETVPTAIQSSQTFSQVSFDGQHACALTTAGAAYCWGTEDHGDLGSGSFSTSGATPVAVAGGLTFRTIAAGGESNCGYTTTNVMYCWGSNVVQQLGLSPSADSMYAAPVPVPGMGGGP